MSETCFYHYTDEAGRNAILESGFIKASEDKLGDAAFGDGVYGTTLDPFNFSKWTVAANNYDSTKANWLKFLALGKVDYAFKIRLPSRKVKRIPHSKRRILLHKGNIYLKKYVFEVIKVEEFESDDTSSDSEESSEEETDSETTEDSEETDSDESAESEES